MENRRSLIKSCERPFPGKYRETSSDIDKEPIMFVQFIQK